jgi:1,4-dihydroxy-6-naphthoate synthase
MTTLRLGHSPDPDDAFMWWPLANFTAPDGTDYRPQIDTAGFEFQHVLEDIQSLNQRTESDDPAERLEITAISFHQYPHVADHYAITDCGASMGDGYGPMIVSREPIHLDDLVYPVDTPDPDHRPTLAIPGTRTTAWLTLQLMMLEKLGVQPSGPAPLAAPPGGGGVDTLAATRGSRSLDYRVVPFDQIIDKVVDGTYTAGLIIHEGQLTYADAGLHRVIDLGAWWKDTRGLPLPLGCNCIRRDVGDAATLQKIAGVLGRSIDHALDHRPRAVEFALQWARGMGGDLADRFVGMYVNDLTRTLGDAGRQSVQQLLTEGADAGIVPPLPGDAVDFIDPA